MEYNFNTDETEGGYADAQSFPSSYITDEDYSLMNYGKYMFGFKVLSHAEPALDDSYSFDPGQEHALTSISNFQDTGLPNSGLNPIYMNSGVDINAHESYMNNPYLPYPPTTAFGASENIFDGTVAQYSSSPFHEASGSFSDTSELQTPPEPVEYAFEDSSSL